MSCTVRFLLLLNGHRLFQNAASLKYDGCDVIILPAHTILLTRLLVFVSQHLSKSISRNIDT